MISPGSIPIVSAAQQFKLDPLLVDAIVHQESGYVSESARFEPSFRWITPDYQSIAKALRITSDTEKTFQATSWGLMHIMGAVARERGFKGFLPSLCDPATGLYWGCAQLAYLTDKFSDDLDHAIAAYNAGPGVARVNGVFPNQTYVDSVKAYLDFNRSRSMGK